AGQVGVHEADFSKQKRCLGLGQSDVSSAKLLQSLSVPDTRDALACSGLGLSGQCVMVQRDWLSTGAIRASGILSAQVLDRARAVPVVPPSHLLKDIVYGDADYA